MIRQCAILFGCLALGELIVFLTGIKLPSSIIGMLLLTLFLKLGDVRFFSSQPGLFLHSARCGPYALF